MTVGPFEPRDAIVRRLDAAEALLKSHLAIFQRYARNHREKVPGLEKLAGAEKAIEATLEKAEANSGHAALIERYFAEAERSSAGVGLQGS